MDNLIHFRVFYQREILVKYPLKYDCRFRSTYYVLLYDYVLLQIHIFFSKCSPLLLTICIYSH